MQKISFQHLVSEYAERLIRTPGILTAAKNNGEHNGMTVSWGSVGIMWKIPTLFVFVRPERYTHGIIENGDFVSLSFFTGAEDALRIYGTTSGRNTDKEEVTGLHYINVGDIPAYAEADLVLGGKILYMAPLIKCGIREDGIRDFYLKEGMHSLVAISLDGIFVNTGNF